MPDTRPPTFVTFAAPGVPVAADTARRTLTGQVAPFDVYANVSTGQRVAFAPGSLTVAAGAVLNLDHDPGRPVGVALSSHATAADVQATFRVPQTPAGDLALLEAAEGLRPGLSVGADLLDALENADGSLYVTAARVRHVALLSEPAFDTARVLTVTAAAPTTTAPTTAEEPAMSDLPPVEPDPVEPDPELTLTAAGRAAQTMAAGAGQVTSLRESYPYPIVPTTAGPWMVRDIALAGDGNPDALARLRKAQAMANEIVTRPELQGRVHAAGSRAQLRATGTTVANPQIIPPGYRPDLFVNLIQGPAPLWSLLAKYPIADFTAQTVPRVTAYTALSGLPTDEITDVAGGTITTALDTIPVQEVQGKYQFSRQLALSSNPSIDQIALEEMDLAWSKDVETRAIAFFAAAANHTAQSIAVSTGAAYIAALRKMMAHMRTTRFLAAGGMVCPGLDYEDAVAADDGAQRPLLGWGQDVYNTAGAQGDAAASASILGVPLLPAGAAPVAADNTFMVTATDAVGFSTPIWNFRFESDATNVKVLSVVKYSGVAFWARHKEGIFYINNTGVLPLAAEAAAAGDAKKK